MILSLVNLKLEKFSKPFFAREKNFKKETI